MPSGKHKSRTLRRVYRKTPGGKTRILYRNRKPKKVSCANCGAGLIGVTQMRTVKARNGPKTKKRPQRPYGGVLCGQCSRTLIKNNARMEK